MLPKHCGGRNHKKNKSNNKINTIPGHPSDHTLILNQSLWPQQCLPRIAWDQSNPGAEGGV